MVILCYDYLIFEAPIELKKFLDTHRFAQRQMADGNDPSTLNTHQPLDMIHEEIIRLELLNLDRNRLKRNADTGRMERDPEVFTQAATLLGFFGEGFVKRTEASNSTTRKYDKYYKQVLLIRSQLCISGFLADYANPGLPFFLYSCFRSSLSLKLKTMV